MAERPLHELVTLVHQRPNATSLDVPRRACDFVTFCPFNLLEVIRRGLMCRYSVVDQGSGIRIVKYKQQMTKLGEADDLRGANASNGHQNYGPVVV